ncbi:MAG: hypothetical protein EG823_06860 [Actinobacteria bacterium]|nr:hypothetical protein [Actinomycetota bacterium]
MRLHRIEAVRFGALAGLTLGDLGDGLNIVYGPNEAGKSSLRNLVYQVLYRFPTAREQVPTYDVPGEGRVGRLVFDDASGSWVIERTAGTHGGKVSIRALRGAERPDLLDELTRGVSETAYRTVLGFGLAEMADLERMRSSGDSVISRLFAASAGLRTSPQEVRGAIDREAGELFKPTGRKPEVNALVAELRTTRADARKLREEAESFIGDQERLKGLDESLEEARKVRDAARERATELAVAVERADEKLAAISASEEASKALRRDRKQLEDEVAALAIDEALLAAAPEIDALLEEAAGHAHTVQSLDELEAAVLRADTRVADAVARTGLAPEAIEALSDCQGCLVAVEEARDEIQRLQLQAESRSESAQRVSEMLAAATAALGRHLEPLGIAAADASEAIAERLAVLDALESLRGSVTVHTRRGVDVPSLVMLASGVVALVTGLALREWVTVGVGVVLVAAGAVFTLRARPGASVAPEGDECGYLKTLGLEPEAGTLEVSRLRRALEAARTAAHTVAEAQHAAEDAERDARLASESLATRLSLWTEWLSQHGLEAAMTPAAAAARVALVRDEQVARIAAGEASGAHAHATAQIDTFAARLSGIAGAFVEVPSETARTDVAVIVNRLKEALASARAAVARRDEAQRLIASLVSRIEGEDEKRTAAGAELLELLVHYGLADGGTHEDLRVLRASAEREVSDATAAFDTVAQVKHQLEGRLEAGVREERAGELHIREAGQVERLGDAVQSYLVLAVASRLLADAQARYESERQPEVVRSASGIFSVMTGGRYVGLTVPLSEGRIEVFDTKSGVMSSDILSQGTADQLYLALRLGLIEQLGDVGAGLPVLMDDVLVNFDPERRRGAAEAIAEAASGRQVVFFTCHPDTADLLAEVAPDHVRLDLPQLAI